MDILVNKKNKLFLGTFLICCSLLLLSGCGSSNENSKSENKVICSTEVEEVGEMTMHTEVVATLKNDKVSSVVATLTFDSDDTASMYYSFLSLYDSYLENGASLDMQQNKNKIIIQNFQYMIEEGSNDGETLDIKIIGETKENYISIMEKEQFSCKK